MGKPKSIYFFTHYSSMNGANQSLLTLIKYLKDKVEIKKVFVPLNKDNNEGIQVELKKIGIPFETLNLRPFLYFSGFKSFLAVPLKFVMNIPSWIKIYKELKTKDIDWIYSNSSVENSGIVIAKLLGVKHIWHIREFGFKDYHYYFVGGDTLKRKVIDQSNRIIAISKAISEYVNLPEKTTLIHNGIFYEKELVSLKGKGSLPTKINLGMVGIIGVAKNQKRAVALLKNLKHQLSQQVILNFYGGVAENEYLEELKNEVNDLGLNDLVKFHGFVNDKNEIYRNIDILLMCSSNEAFGRVTVEAMAYGIPVIGYDNAGTSELISDGVNSLLYDDDIKSLEDVAFGLIQNHFYYEKISRSARESASLYSVEEYGGSIFDLISEN